MTNSPYLNRPLRSLNEAIRDRAERRAEDRQRKPAETPVREKFTAGGDDGAQ